ncbi:hypothetical protein [Acidocella sp.]|uniref:hypothetical protein n=1 Tax=Acidocella sp. TaxID=50710 RepID=UPI003CFCFBBB
MDRDLRRSAIVSFVIHAAIIIAAIVTLPMQPLNTSADESVDVDLVGPTQPQTAQTAGKVAAPNNTPVPHEGPVNPTQPKPQPVVAPPPPPPPPPPAPEQKPTPTPPTPAAPPPPPAPTPTPQPVPPPPPPQPPQKQQSTQKPPPKPVEEKKPPAPEKSATHQQHEVKNPMPLSKNVLNTLSQLRVNQKQDKPPTSQYNPDQGGAPDGGGSPNSTANSHLSEADRNAIGAHVRPCWGIDAGAPGIQGFSVQLLVTTDASGTVRQAVVAPASQGDMGNPLYAAYAQRAIAAVENYQCATLPLPSYMLGKVQTFLFNFTP